LDKVPALDKAEVDDVILGCAQPEGEQGWDIARWAVLRAGLPVEVPGVTVNRLCSSGLEAIALADLRIRSGGDRVVIAGGAESMSLLPFGGLKPSPNPYMAEHYPASLLTMGLTAERVARHYSVTREDQDAFALASHRKALAAQAAGRFNDELIPVTVTTAVPGTKAGQAVVTEQIFSADEGPRADTSAEALAKLKPAFHAQGTVTAGNSSQTSDGAAAGFDGERSRTRAGYSAARPAGGLRRNRLPAGGDGHRSHHRYSQGAEEGRADLGRDWLDRTERSICIAGAGHHPRAGTSMPSESTSTGAPSPSAIRWAAQAQSSPRRCSARCAAARFATAW
jgi:acetyl-CoA acetyltransferase